MQYSPPHSLIVFSDAELERLLQTDVPIGYLKPALRTVLDLRANVLNLVRENMRLEAEVARLSKLSA